MRPYSGRQIKIGEQSVFAIKKELVERLVKFELADAVEFAEWLSQKAKTIAEAWEKIAKGYKYKGFEQASDKWSFGNDCVGPERLL